MCHGISLLAFFGSAECLITVTVAGLLVLCLLHWCVRVAGQLRGVHDPGVRSDVAAGPHVNAGTDGAIWWQLSPQNPVTLVAMVTRSPGWNRVGGLIDGCSGPALPRTSPWRPSLSAAVPWPTLGFVGAPSACVLLSLQSLQCLSWSMTSGFGWTVMWSLARRKAYAQRLSVPHEPHGTLPRYISLLC